MDTIEFEAKKSKLRFRINGTDFLKTVKEFEMPFAKAEGSRSIAGAYARLPLRYEDDTHPQPIKFLMGAEHDYFKKAPLFICDCGIEACWPLLSRIIVGEDSVTWCEFEQPHRGEHKKYYWNYSNLGPFVFDKSKYFRSLKYATGEIT